MLARTLWPSGLRRWLKAPFRKGVGSNPTGVIFWISGVTHTMLDCCTKFLQMQPMNIQNALYTYEQYYITHMFAVFVATQNML